MPRSGSPGLPGHAVVDESTCRFRKVSGSGENDDRFELAAAIDGSLPRSQHHCGPAGTESRCQAGAPIFLEVPALEMLASVIRIGDDRRNAAIAGRAAAATRTACRLAPLPHERQTGGIARTGRREAWRKASLDRVGAERVDTGTEVTQTFTTPTSPCLGSPRRQREIRTSSSANAATRSGTSSA